MNNLKALRTQKGILQKDLAQMFNVSQATLSQWETGKFQIPDEYKLKFAEFFGVSVDYLLGLKEKDPEQAIKIPILGKVVAGIPLEAITDVLGYEEISPTMSRTGEYFALRISGQSMSPKIENGDIAIVRKQEDVDSGDIAIVFINDNEATCKQIIKQDNGLLIQGFNYSVFSPMFIPSKAAKNIKIIGKVIELRRRF